ncbi:MAG TPA: S28 family serine protease [Kofleriaceae bacterium]|nr:S28 family serine protease [Kofleriaceae bacterium]
MRTAVLLATLAACGDNLKPPDIVDRLRELPGVADATVTPTADPGYEYIVMHFEQPVDHDDPASPTFLQEVSLLHRDSSAPMIVHTSGYWDYYKDAEVELTILLAANQISIEHRFFGDSVPDPADWTKLTIAQMAADEHAIVSALRQVYSGAFLATGASKGGMTSVFYRRFYPDDVDGTVPYVAPIMYADPDERFPPFIAAIDPGACHQAIEDAAVEIIKNRRAAMEQRAQTQAQAMGYAYTRIALGPAVESAIEDLEWSFWQYYGVDYCDTVPPVTASDDDMFNFLDTIAVVHESDDAETALFQGYYYQVDNELGYPDDGTTYLKPYYMYTAADFAGALPTPTAPAYDNGAAMHDVDGFVEQQGSRLLFVYGQWDPWSGGAYVLGGAQDSLLLTEAQGTHDSHLTELATADEQAAFAKLAAWTGVTPAPAMRIAPEPRAPHVPPALRALHQRLAAP